MLMALGVYGRWLLKLYTNMNIASSTGVYIFYYRDNSTEVNVFCTHTYYVRNTIYSIGRSTNLIDLINYTRLIVCYVFDDDNNVDDLPVPYKVTQFLPVSFRMPGNMCTAALHGGKSGNGMSESWLSESLSTFVSYRRKKQTTNCTI